MKADEYLRYYSAQIPVIGKAAQEKLREIKVLIVGLGGLGSNMALSLAMLGVCDISVIDPQKLEASNLNRWPFGGRADIGLPKVRAAARFFARTPHIGFTGLGVKNEHPQSDRLYRLCDWVFSCANTVSARIAAARKAIRFKKPLIDLAVSDGGKPLRGVIKYWLPQNADWSACPECYLPSRKGLPRDEGLLFTPIAITASLAVHIFLALVTEYHDSFFKSRNLLTMDLEGCRTDIMAVQKRPDCRGCRPADEPARTEEKAR